MRVQRLWRSSVLGCYRRGLCHGQRRTGAGHDRDKGAARYYAPHVTRYALVYGLLLVVVAFVVIYLLLGHRVHL